MSSSPWHRLGEGHRPIAVTCVELGEILRRTNASDDVTCSLHRMRRVFHLVIEFFKSTVMRFSLVPFLSTMTIGWHHQLEGSDTGSMMRSATILSS